VNRKKASLRLPSDVIRTPGIPATTISGLEYSRPGNWVHLDLRTNATGHRTCTAAGVFYLSASRCIIVSMTTTLHLLTGILGSGKTSVLRHLLDSPLVDSRIAVVVGEFADEGFDGRLLDETGATIQELTGDPIRVGASPYVSAVRKLLTATKPSSIFVETSGVADIGKIGGALCEDHGVMSQATMGRSIAVVDAGAFRLHERHFPEQLWAQVEAADIVAVNKTDKAMESDLNEIRRKILKRQPNARVLFCYMGQVRRREVFEPVPEDFRSALLDVAGRQDTAPADFESFIYRSDLICFDRADFGHLLLNLPGKRIARFKGVVRSYDRSHGLNGIPGQLDWENQTVGGPTRIAFIGLGLTARRDTISALLDEALLAQQEDRR